jgi:hypothetical protein
MANTLETRQPTDDDRRELVVLLRDRETGTEHRTVLADRGARISDYRALPSGES